MTSDAALDIRGVSDVVEQPEQPEHQAEMIVEALRRAGASIEFEDGSLWVEPADVLDDDLRAAIRRYKAAIVRVLLPREVRWRLDAMMLQVPVAGPIKGMLMARDAAWPDEAWRCASCGDWTSLFNYGDIRVETAGERENI